MTLTAYFPVDHIQSKRRKFCSAKSYQPLLKVSTFLANFFDKTYDSISFVEPLPGHKKTYSFTKNRFFP